MIPYLAPGGAFPPVARALSRPNGLLAAGADLTPDTLVRAYRLGIFPWYGEGEPILWWSPDPRMVLPCAAFHLSRSLRRRLQRGGFRVTFDTAFDAVLAACAAPRAEDTGTWLGAEMHAAYVALQAAGHAHSVEVWMDDELAGGVYGVAIGRMFFGESMFTRRTDGSKIALAYLAAQLLRWDMPLIDCQMETEHLASLGARTVSRRRFSAWVAALCRQPGPRRWVFEAGLDPVRVLREGAELDYEP